MVVVHIEEVAHLKNRLRPVSPGSKHCSQIGIDEPVVSGNRSRTLARDGALIIMAAIFAMIMRISVGYYARYHNGT
jgi:hypothetical protein